MNSTTSSSGLVETTSPTEVEGSISFEVDGVTKFLQMFGGSGENGSKAKFVLEGELDLDSIKQSIKQTGDEQMADSQSRYSTIEQLNTKKINARDGLTELERVLDERTFETEKNIETVQSDADKRKTTYKRFHKNWKREREIEIELLEKEHARKVEKLAEDIKERDLSYEEDFKKWLANKQQEVKNLAEGLVRFKQTQTDKINAQKKIIEDYEKTINDLKEISKETDKAE